LEISSVHYLPTSRFSTCLFTIWHVLHPHGRTVLVLLQFALTLELSKKKASSLSPFHSPSFSPLEVTGDRSVERPKRNSEAPTPVFSNPADRQRKVKPGLFCPDWTAKTD